MREWGAESLATLRHAVAYLLERGDRDEGFAKLDGHWRIGVSFLLCVSKRTMVKCPAESRVFIWRT